MCVENPVTLDIFGFVALAGVKLCNFKACHVVLSVFVSKLV